MTPVPCDYCSGNGTRVFHDRGPCPRDVAPEGWPLPHWQELFDLRKRTQNQREEIARLTKARPVVETRIETQAAISAWADETFGPAGSNARVAARSNEEMSELLKALTSDDNHPKAKEEAADVVIVLYRLAERMGADLHEEIDKKMAKNRARTWTRDGTGHGYHVKGADSDE